MRVKRGKPTTRKPLRFPMPGERTEKIDPKTGGRAVSRPFCYFELSVVSCQ
jgi:hypothetical protein